MRYIFIAILFLSQSCGYYYYNNDIHKLKQNTDNTCWAASLGSVIEWQTNKKKAPCEIVESFVWRDCCGNEKDSLCDIQIRSDGIKQILDAHNIEYEYVRALPDFEELKDKVEGGVYLTMLCTLSGCHTVVITGVHSDGDRHSVYYYDPSHLAYNNDKHARYYYLKRYIHHMYYIKKGG